MFKYVVEMFVELEVILLCSYLWVVLLEDGFVGLFFEVMFGVDVYWFVEIVVIVLILWLVLMVVIEYLYELMVLVFE